MKMTKFFLGLFILGVALIGATVVFAQSSNSSNLNWGQEINAGKCVKPKKQVINVKQRIENSVDSGIAGNYWAFSNYDREIQVWEQEGGTYCALVRYQGKFDGQEGQTSPGAKGVLTGTEDGPFEGGYRATINGSLKTNPAWKTNGNIGTVNYQCNIAGNCPGSVNWVGVYFNSGFSFSYDWWGWVYQAGKASWINSITANKGDVL